MSSKRIDAAAADSDHKGAVLKAAREKAGFTQKDVAEALDVDPVTVSRWERGVNTPDRAALVALSALFRVKLVDDRRLDSLPSSRASGRLMSKGDWNAVLRSEPVEAYLDTVQKELRALGVPHDERDAALRAVRQPPRSSARDPGAPWTAEEIVHVMKLTAEPILEMWRIWSRLR